MTTKNTGRDGSADLRRRAEEILREAEAKTKEPLSPEESVRAFHELQVHQIELEMQNEELRRAQEELEALRARYFDLYDLAPVGYFILSEKGLILEANLTAATLLGMARGTLVKEPLTRFILPEDQDTYYLHRKQLFETGGPQMCELRMLGANASRFGVRLEGIVAQDADGAPVCRVVMSDITEHKRVEDEREKLQAQLANAVEMAHLGHWEYDVANDLFTFNDHFYKIFNTTAKQAGGYTMSSAEYARRFVHPDDIPVVGEETRKAIEARDPAFSRQLEHRMLYADGTVGYISVRFFIVKDTQGRTVKTYGVNQDITERKHAEEELRESEKKARRMAEVNGAMAKIGRIISSTLSIEDVYEQFAAEVNRIIPFDRIAVGLINHEQGTYRFAYASGLELPGRHKGYSLPLPAIVREVISKRSVFSLYSEDEKEFLDDYPEFLIPFRSGVRSVMAAPLISADQVVGVLYLNSLNSKAYTERDVQLAENVASQIAGAIVSAQLHAEIKKAEEALLEREEKFRTIFGGIAQLCGYPLHIVVMDR